MSEQKPERLKRPERVKSPEFARLLKLSREHPCPACGGIRKPCDVCKGTGEIERIPVILLSEHEALEARVAVFVKQVEMVARDGLTSQWSGHTLREALAAFNDQPTSKGEE